MDKDLSQKINMGLDYKYTTGSIYSGINRDVSGNPNKKNSSIVEQNSSGFFSNSITAKLDTDLAKIVKDFSSTLKLSFSKIQTILK